MELQEVRRRRRMVRRFTADEVGPDVMDRILDAGVRVPSAGFTQAVSLLVLTDEERERFWAVTTDPDRAPDRWLTGMRTAPVLILVWTDPDAYLDRYAESDKGWTDRDPGRWTAPYWWVDAGMTVLAMLYAAVDEGLGGCFFGAPPASLDAVRTVYGVPEGQRLVGVVALGTPDEPPKITKRTRRPAAELVHRGSW